VAETDDSSDDDSLLLAVARAPEREPDTSADWIGRTIGRFRVLRRIGSGGMGVVFEVMDERLGRRIALKVLPTGHDVEGRARFVREGRNASQVTHPHIAVIYDAGEEGDVAYIAMELVLGETLRERLASGATRGELVGWLREVASALAAAHDHGIVHRDIKPDNVMIRHDGRAVVLDFGIARRISREGDPVTPTHQAETLTRDGHAVGTPSYMAPEQLKGDPIDGRTDQFSWGVVAFECLSGTLPWGRRSEAVHLMAAILSEPPTALPADVPKGLAAVVRRALEKDASRRFASMHDVIDALTRESHEAPPARRTWIVAALVATTVAAAWGYQSWRAPGAGAQADSSSRLSTAPPPSAVPQPSRAVADPPSPPPSAARAADVVTASALPVAPPSLPSPAAHPPPRTPPARPSSAPRETAGVVSARPDPSGKILVE
jgi:serine/threonine protein kinase